MPRSNAGLLRQGLEQMFEAMRQQVAAADEGSVSELIVGLDSMWEFACERSEAAVTALELWAELPARSWARLPARAKLNVMLLSEIFESEDYPDLIPALYDQCLRLLLRLNFDLGAAAAIELRLMLEDLPSLWALIGSQMTRGKRSWMSRELHRIETDLADQLGATADRTQVADHDRPLGWETSSAVIIALCDKDPWPGDEPAFGEAFRAARQLYERLGFYAAAAPM